jgi:CheY-like chemotaxis protein
MKKNWLFAQRTKILAVDDEVGFTRLLALAATQYEIRGENDPRRAIDAAVEFHPDLILVDRFMPKITGESLARSIESHPKLGHIPIAFVTASVPRDDEGQFCTHLNGHPILMKPVSINQIDQCVRSASRGSSPGFTS